MLLATLLASLTSGALGPTVTLRGGIVMPSVGSGSMGSCGPDSFGMIYFIISSSTATEHIYCFTHPSFIHIRSIVAYQSAVWFPSEPIPKGLSDNIHNCAFIYFGNRLQAPLETFHVRIWTHLYNILVLAGDRYVSNVLNQLIWRSWSRTASTTLAVSTYCYFPPLFFNFPPSPRVETRAAALPFSPQYKTKCVM